MFLSGTNAIAMLLDAREMLEVPAARLTAIHRSDAELEGLAFAVEIEETDARHHLGFDRHESFHVGVLAAVGNGLLPIITRPIFTVLRTRLQRDEAPTAFWRTVADDHRRSSTRSLRGTPNVRQVPCTTTCRTYGRRMSGSTASYPSGDESGRSRATSSRAD